jgi:3-oxoacyl-[acyl-carrier protein] reductase
MNLNLSDRFFVVTGAGSGFGRAVAEALIAEGASVLAVARTAEVLEAFQHKHQKHLHIVVGDVQLEETQKQIFAFCSDRFVDGILVNAGGPPAKAFMETELKDWDDAYYQLVRWKVAFVKLMIQKMLAQNYGRIVFIESVSVKQPVENLVLSNALRAAVVGLMKSLSQDVAHQNITLNMIAPGYHNTAAMQRLFKKKADIEKITLEEAKTIFERQLPVGRMGEADELARLACWLLSPLSRFVTGQTISHDGGMVKGLFG